jgi:hypothetical protein
MEHANNHQRYGLQFQAEVNTVKNPHAAQYKVITPRQDTPQPSATPRTVTFDRNPSGHLGQHTEITEVKISVEDLATLAQDPEFSSLPDNETLNYEYFEQTVQADNKEDEPAIHHVPPVKAKKVKPVCRSFLPETFTDEYLHSLRTFLQTGSHSMTRMSMS